MTIVEFLLARIREDEDQALDLIARQRRKLTVKDVSLGYVRAFDPKRVVDECKAKRRIVEWECRYRTAVEKRGESWAHRATGPMRALAAVYADHPDYDEVWRP